MPVVDPRDTATELDRIAAVLEWSINRDDWWGPARVAFDAEVTQQRTIALALAVEARALP